MSQYDPRGYDGVVTCPYNACHQILRHRMQTHLVKCRKSYPDVVMKVCPFNAAHHIPQVELAHHIESCVNRASYENYKYNVAAGPAKTQNEPEQSLKKSLQQIQNDDNDDGENWDDACTGKSAYNPKAYVQEAKIIQASAMNGLTPSEKKLFREKERLRHNRVFDDRD